MPGSESKRRVPYSRKPRDMSLDQWQAVLRKQFASDQNFRITNLGNHPVYSDFEVFNPVTDKTYKVSIKFKNDVMKIGIMWDKALGKLGFK